MHPVTTTDYFTFNVNNSALILGPVGSGKSYLVENLIKMYSRAHSPAQLQWAFFDFTRVEFTPAVKEYGLQDYLLFPVVQEPDQALQKLDELAQMSEQRAKNNASQPLIFICIDESDAAVTDPGKFASAVTTINKNAPKANMKLIYSTSRINANLLPQELRGSFELLLIGDLVKDEDYQILGFKRKEMRLLTGWDFNIVNQS